ncbi:coiled-coil domain-containing protein 150 isoform X1 [Pantherophis guttatus]|uniref:Coiled-coil domain-containing protein 150 isoform X1 n=1 Tax=Pantherophis guttatus TaxID=94885 RepID=A0A6P9D264_PANGU|nr:coiled-coil domain-containing protein 150 isoform X1 [Pantherophis guttatus]XP_034285751.1 coiled-coil domain-containing protein 150 isoform X1 [Pantherophis guttatus]XP_034285755.1 coiled-coil domain-containing protein 150 isoform X1 [Pantherophis guttatus]XP_060544068.1 coiled-coil domain-containing protein 150 isoform X1 [Pantherophis guttatus]
MARPVISPMDVQPTAPETFVVLNQRMKVVEEETSELLNDLQKMGVNRHSMELLAAKHPVNSEDHQSISPVQVRTAFVEPNNSLWRTCETLVNRICRLESVIQTVKLNIFRLQTEKELNPKHAANLEQRLNTIQEEHMEELKVLQMEGRMLCQQLKESREEEEKARDQVKKLSAALEMATTTKRDVTISAEELRATKEKMNNKLQEIMEKLSKESSSRESLEQGQVVLLYQMRDMEEMVEKEQKQVQILQQDCNILRHDIQLSQERLQKEQEKIVQLEQECIHLKADLEFRDKTIFKLSEEVQTAQLSLNAAQEKNAKFRSKIFTLQEVTSKAQKLNQQLAQQCTELNDALQKATEENAQLTSDHQAALQMEEEKMHQKLKEQDLILDAARASVTGELQVVQKEKAQLEKELEDLRTEHAECKKRDCKEIVYEKARLERTVSQTQNDLETIIQDRNSLLNEKKILEEESQQTIQETRKTIEKLETELTEKKLEINYLQESVKALEKEKREFLEQDAALKHQKLKVQQLEEELQSLIYVQSENNQLRTFCIALKAEYDQTQSLLVCREEALSLSVKSHDEALRENQKLRGQIGAIEEREKRKLANLQRKLEESKEDNIKMTTILQNVLASHNKMQVALEKVQIELDHKDSDIAGLKKDRTQNEQRIQTLEEELEEYQNKLALDSQRNAKLNSLRKSLETSKLDKKKLIQNLEQTLQTNSALESKLSLVQDELESKEAECQQLVQCRDQLIEETKRETKFYADRLETLKKQFQTEREVAKKSAQKESAEVKKALEEACSKSAEILRCNKELRAKVIDLEAALTNQKEKVKKQKILITQYFNSKTNNIHNAEKIKEIELELRQMEDLKDLYQKKNYEQSHSIKQFATELTSLQSEMQQLAKNQQVMENQLEEERKKRKQFEEECRTLEDTIKELKKCKAATEEKLKEASIESQQISANLEEAHHWFKSKFDCLQRELVKNRKPKLDEESEEENKPVKIPSQACLKRWETKNHLKLISRKYLTEQNN